MGTHTIIGSPSIKSLKARILKFDRAKLTFNFNQLWQNIMEDLWQDLTLNLQRFWNSTYFPHGHRVADSNVSKYICM